ncbi:Phage protein [Peribacillus simplex]|uniref:Phage protein n=1 Tax=Peribacillus simplex TaxID=1478 RepID=A0AAN2TRT8_9BACI|nr:Phage protein [Peribacillus simplex]
MSLKRLTFLNRSQLQILNGLGGDRNAQKVLKSMSEYVNSFRSDGQTIYYLTKEGRTRVDCKKKAKKSTTAQHYIMRNDLYIACKFPKTWKNEVDIKVKGLGDIRCDAMFTVGEKPYFIEIDHTQKMKINEKKMETYRKIINAFPFQPVFLWVTTTEYKRNQLKKLCEGLESRIYIASELKN